MASEAPVQEDPLIAALPPATDYMTYLTLLEYQLTPHNLATLTKLLTDDDGKLVEEIGWDLLRLVLPMLGPDPAEAGRCLQVIARRGNPREVVVRIAEELEKLGDAGDDWDERDHDGDGDDEEAALPTFAGEAPPVHLGSMKLAGAAASPPAEGAQDPSSTLPADSIKALKLQALVDMLGVLHPRIKTQYPSRFLATSLPAALGAYRQVPISTATTASFVSMLERVGGKQRPPLPPRLSSTGTPAVGVGLGITPPPRPDPEAQGAEAGAAAAEPSPEERAIIARLLNAVTLEVLDEYLSSLASEEYPSMCWTARLREGLEPQRVVPGRPTVAQVWADTQELQDRDALLLRFQQLGQDLNVNVRAEVRKLLHDTDDDEHEEHLFEPGQEHPSEYPTSPAQIPFPRAGVIFLHAHASYRNHGTATALTTTELTKLIAHSFPLSATPTIPSPALQDALLSLLYRQTVAGPPPAPDAGPSPAKILLLLSTLTQLFTITPSPDLRDAAHYIAGKLLHAYPDRSVRIQVVSQTLQGSTLSTNWAEIEDEPNHEPPGIDEETGLTRSTSALQPHPIPLAPPQQMGLLKAVGVDWLKDEILAWTAARPASAAEATRGIDPSMLGEKLDEVVKAHNKFALEDIDTPPLLDLVFPTDLPTLSAPTPTDASADDADRLTPFLLSIPFFIATLNLECVMLPQLPPTDSTTGSLLPLMSRHTAAVRSSTDFLLSLLHHASGPAATGAPGAAGGDGDAMDEDVLQESRADILALDDACTRATAALGKTKVPGGPAEATSKPQ